MVNSGNSELLHAHHAVKIDTDSMKVIEDTSFDAEEVEVGKQLLSLSLPPPPISYLPHGMHGWVSLPDI